MTTKYEPRRPHRTAGVHVCCVYSSSPHKYASLTPINPRQEDTGVQPFHRQLWLPCRMDTHVHSSTPAQPIHHQFNSDQQPDPKNQAQYQIFNKSTISIDFKIFKKFSITGE